MKKRKDGRYCRKIKIDGEYIFFYSSAPTEKQAARDIDRQLLEYQERAEKGKTFKEAAELWTAYHYPTIEHNTLKQYRPAVRDVVEQFGDCYIKAMTSNQVDLFIRAFAKRGYAQKTVKTRLLVVNLIMKYAVINGFIPFNPCQYITVPKNLPKTKREGLTDDETAAVRNNTDKEFGLFAFFVLNTGLRRGEALALRYSDIDYGQNVIKVRKTVIWKGNKPEIKSCPKTDAGNRDVPFLDCLKPYFPPLEAESLIFPNESGELLHNGNFTRLWNKYRKATGLCITPHQLRHAYATMLYDAGIDIKSAQYLMGHANIQTTLDIYTHLSQTRKRNAGDILNGFISGNVNMHKETEKVVKK